MTDKNNKMNDVEKKYEELVKELKKELPNIVLPSMGMLDDSECVDINGKEFVIGNKEV